jgi:prepilin-type N-terminal cleavage/methylation domain-containing protein
MKNTPAFTLIELLVVISIIGILSSLSIVSVGSSRAKARTARVKNDVTALGKSVSSLGTTGSIISNNPGAGADVLTSGGGGTLRTIFTGVENADSLSYGATSTNPPANYEYGYYVPTTPSSGVRQLLDGTSDFSVYTQLREVDNSFFGFTQSGLVGYTANPSQATLRIANGQSCSWSDISSAYSCSTSAITPPTRNASMTLTPTGGGSATTISNLNSYTLATSTITPGTYTISFNFTKDPSWIPSATPLGPYLAATSYNAASGFQRNYLGNNPTPKLVNPVTFSAGTSYDIGFSYIAGSGTSDFINF